jgi:hypothetical protein
MITEVQVGIQKETFCADGCFMLKLLIENCRELNLQTYGLYISRKPLIESAGTYY